MLKRLSITIRAHRHSIASLFSKQQPENPITTVTFTTTSTTSSPSSTPSPSSPPLYSACVFERLPVVMPPTPQWEIDYVEWRSQLTENRFKAFPKEFIEDRRAAEEASPSSSSSSQSDRWRAAAITTPADVSGDRSTTKRRLDQRIFMLVKKRNGTWEIPHVELSGGETTRQGAVRALSDVLGTEGYQRFFVGNAPAGHVVLPSGSFFFHRCQLIQGRPSLNNSNNTNAGTGGVGVGNKGWSEIAWAAKDELGEYVKDKNTLELLQKML